jgi:hypothetical protein
MEVLMLSGEKWMFPVVEDTSAQVDESKNIWHERMAETINSRRGFEFMFLF